MSLIYVTYNKEGNHCQRGFPFVDGSQLNLILNVSYTYSEDIRYLISAYFPTKVGAEKLMKLQLKLTIDKYIPYRIVLILSKLPSLPNVAHPALIAA